MIKSKQRLRAFTILEMTVSMLVAAIVIAITYTAYVIISKSYAGFKNKNEEMAVLARVDQLLRRDFERANHIKGTENAISMYGIDGQQITYELAAGYLVRNAQRIDTFKVGSEHYQVFFEHIKKSGTNITAINDKESDRIDEFSFVATFKTDTIPYHYYKQYSSLNLINRNPNAIN